MTTSYKLTINDGAFIFTPNEPLIQRVLFSSPVTGYVGDVWGADWFDATGFGTYYTASGSPAYHTGCDLNRPGYADAGAHVCASADGYIVFAGIVPGWQQSVVVIKHTLEDESFIWTRYAHIKNITPIGQTQPKIKRGDQIGTIADYTPTGPQGDHLHYDVARVDLGIRPGDWPGADKARLMRDYIDPVKWHTERSK